MTNISNETRAKVIAQYIGQGFVDKYEAYPKYKYVLIGVCKSEYQIDSENVWLALSNGNEFTVEGIQFTSIRPLSAITDEHKIIIGDMLGWKEQPVFVRRVKAQSFIESIVDEVYTYYPTKIIPIYQKLIEWGYDMPNELLGGKTLREAGLALYQNDLK